MDEISASSVKGSVLGGKIDFSKIFSRKGDYKSSPSVGGRTPMKSVKATCVMCQQPVSVCCRTPVDELE